MISMYHLHMHRWLEIFSRNQLLVVNGDQLIEDPLSQLRRIESFLGECGSHYIRTNGNQMLIVSISFIRNTGIEHRISKHNFYFNETKGFYCLRNDTADKCLRETKGRKHPHVDPQVISKLRKFFAEHNQKFYELVGEDLGWPEE